MDVFNCIGVLYLNDCIYVVVCIFENVPYIFAKLVGWAKTNATIPKEVDPQDMTLERAVELIAARAAKAKTAPPKKKAAKKPAKKKAAAKKTTAKKPASKKTTAKKADTAPGAE